MKVSLSPLEIARVMTLDYPDATPHWLRMMVSTQLIQQGMVANDAWLAAGSALAQLLPDEGVKLPQGDTWVQ